MIRRMFRALGWMVRDRRGAVSPMLTLMLIPMVGALGMGTEASSWFFMRRAMQNAADSAAIAASTNGCASTIASCVTAGGAYYDAEAYSVAAQAGFQNGVNDTTVVATNTAACPTGGATNCYSVTISRRMPIYLIRLVGVNGDTTTTSGGIRAQTVRAMAVASPRGVPSGYCLIGLGTGDAIRINGGPNVDLSGCNMFSNGNLVCNGSNADTGVDYGYAVGTSGCGANKVGGQAALADPFNYLNSNPPIPNPICGSTRPGGPVTTAEAWSAPVHKCGDATLQADVNVTVANSVLMVENGNLNLNGHTLSTSGTGSLTVIFSGVKNDTTTTGHFVVGNGALDIANPTSGPLQGVVLMQDGRVNGAKDVVDATYTGSNPTFNLQGLIYMPNANFTVKGAINLKSLGKHCISVVAKSILVSGTGSVFDNATGECPDAGLSLPGVPGTEARQALVQ